MPNELDLSFAVGLSPENALQYFLSKGYALSYNWQDVWQDQNSKAFTVAKLMELDLLTDVKKINADFIAGNIQFNEAAQMLIEKMKAKGWWGKQKVVNPKTGKEETAQLGSPYRIKTILETNANVSYSAGRYKTQIDAVSFAPYWQYIDMDDNRVRFKHHEIGKLFKNAVLIYNHPFWSKWYPPNDWGCRCRVLNYTLAEVEKRGFKIYTEAEFDALIKEKNIKSPASGWAYNPGEAFKPDLTKYPPGLVKGVGLTIPQLTDNEQ